MGILTIQSGHPGHPRSLLSHGLSTPVNRKILGFRRTTCVIPAADGNVYSSNDSNRNAVLSPGTRVAQYHIVEQSCEKEYYKAGPNRYFICTETGQWQPDISDKLCLSKYAVISFVSDTTRRLSELSRTI